MLLWILAIALLAYGAWLALLYFQQRTVLFPGTGMAPGGGLGPPSGSETVWFDVAGARAEAWLLPASSPPEKGGAPAVIFAHGNAELIDELAKQFDALRKAGLHVLLVEYPGYGRSTGSPSEANLTAVFTEAYDWLAARSDVDAGRIVGMGRSLGGGAITALSRRRELAAIVLQSAFTSVPAMARSYAVPGWLVRDPFDNESALRAYDGPVLLAHGRRDEMIPFRHGQRLAETADAELLAWECGHNDCPPDWEAYLDRVIAFLREQGVLKEGRA
ncbi:MAG TPA: alpha/beta hydrolase [Halomonas sp.]|nr:alpha/beta hydrolase [Halomonas sp.]